MLHSFGHVAQDERPRRRKWLKAGSRMDTWRIWIHGQGNAGQLERTERNLDARVRGTRARGKALRAKRAYMWGQLGPTRLTAAKNDTWHALVSSRGSAPIGSARRTAG